MPSYERKTDTNIAQTRLQFRTPVASSDVNEIQTTINNNVADYVSTNIAVNTFQASILEYSIDIDGYNNITLIPENVNNPNYIPPTIDNPLFDPNIPAMIEDPLDPGNFIPNPDYEEPFIENPEWIALTQDPGYVDEPTSNPTMIPNPEYTPEFLPNGDPNPAWNPTINQIEELQDVLTVDKFRYLINDDNGNLAFRTFSNDNLKVVLQNNGISYTSRLYGYYRRVEKFPELTPPTGDTLVYKDGLRANINNPVLTEQIVPNNILEPNLGQLLSTRMVIELTFVTVPDGETPLFNPSWTIPFELAIINYNADTELYSIEYNNYPNGLTRLINDLEHNDTRAGLTANMGRYIKDTHIDRSIYYKDPLNPKNNGVHKLWLDTTDPTDLDLMYHNGTEWVSTYTKLNAHIAESIVSENGSHDFRFYQNSLDWQDTSDVWHPIFGYLRSPNTPYKVGDIVYDLGLPKWAEIECIVAGTTNNGLLPVVDMVFNDAAVYTGVCIGQQIHDGSVWWVVRHKKAYYEKMLPTPVTMIYVSTGGYNGFLPVHDVIGCPILDCRVCDRTTSISVNIAGVNQNITLVNMVGRHVAGSDNIATNPISVGTSNNITLTAANLPTSANVILTQANLNTIAGRLSLSNLTVLPTNTYSNFTHFSSNIASSGVSPAWNSGQVSSYMLDASANNAGGWMGRNTGAQLASGSIFAISGGSINIGSINGASSSAISIKGQRFETRYIMRIY
jgi:hypothetical protein